MSPLRTSVAIVLLVWAVASGQTPAGSLRVIFFPGMASMPIHVGVAEGIFARHGLALQVEATPNSQVLRNGLAGGQFDVAHAAVDNAVAMVEGAGADVVIVMGGDDSMNELVVQPDIASVADLRDRSVIVDAPNTAYALQLKKILRQRGLEVGRDYRLEPIGGTTQRLKVMQESRAYAASMMNPPFSILAMRSGLRRLGSAAELLGAYQGTGAFVRREWARDHRETLVRYLAAFLQALRWFRAPEHRERAVALVAEKLALPPEVAAEAYARAMTGLARDARLDVEGLRNVLALRAEIEGQWGGRAPAPDAYYDLEYYTAAMARLSPHP